jgi:hypothetical protein
MADITNLDVAVLHKFNQLAERHGLNPTHFVVSMHLGDTRWPGKAALHVHMKTDNPETAGKMLRTAGFSLHGGFGLVLVMHDPSDLYNALAAALDKAPRARSR